MPTLPDLEWEHIGLQAEGPTLETFDLKANRNALGQPAMLVIGAGYWIRLNPGSPRPAYVMMQRPDLAHHRAECSVADALPYLALAMRADDSRRNEVLEALGAIIGPVETLRFAAGLPPVSKGK